MFLLLALFLLVAFVAAQEKTPVIDAVHKGHAVGHEQDGVNAVRAALACGGNVNETDKSDWTPLMWAALECRAGIVDLLLNSGADVNVRASSAKSGSFLDHGQTPLIVASDCFIAHKRADLAPERHMPPDYAAYELAAAGKMVRSMIARGASVNVADVDGRTPLMLAAMQGWSDVVSELLGAHAAVNARDKEGRLAIDYADPADKQTVTRLVKAGSPPSTGNSGRRACDVERALKMSIIDCIADRDLGAAVTKYQQSQNLPVTGEIDELTRAKLNIR
jgi:ankyrin repeat protein